ncbi:uncharacterized protein G2W53_018434 [Senna tora]|uniref:Uncharacterized protein n=1 Tax=Senna tora TaxID=362788 RepID=A0A834WL26_9FABA|nr:uncharacterized protein G2W53_018434 [Senna tora]
MAPKLIPRKRAKQNLQKVYNMGDGEGEGTEKAK